MPDYIPQVALSIQAHPDDQEFSIAGTLAYWALAGCQIYSAVVTSGDSGSNDPSYNGDYKAVLAGLREAEQQAANDLLGVIQTFFLRYPDGILQSTLELRRDLTRIIRKVKPEVVICGDPTMRYSGNYLNHPDHRAAADAAVDAVFPSAGTRLIFPELLEEGYGPYNVRYLYMHGTTSNDTYIDISTTIDLKIQALRKHESQLSSWDPAKMIHEWAASEAKGHGFTYAEGYRRFVLREEDEANQA
jgi:LmbE family N-acetylglucosaminyl deacetylase